MAIDVKTGQEIYNHKATYQAHDIGPLSPPHLKLITGGHQHVGLNSGIFHIAGGSHWAGSMKSIIVWREASSHNNSDDAVLKAVDTYDEGETFTNERVIHDPGGTYDIRNFVVGMMGSARLGIVARRVATGTADHPIFIYSDDAGVTWNTAVLTDMPKSMHGELYPYPASAGGHDTTGFIWYAYNTTAGTITYCKTVDNGANWATGTAITETVAAMSLTEPTVARVYVNDVAQDKWVMIIRDDRDGVNALFCKSTDMTTFTNLTDTGIAMGVNPPYIMPYGDDIYWIAFNRSGTTTAWDDDYPDYAMHQKANALGLYNSNGTSWPGWSKFLALQGQATGYIHIAKRDEIYYGVFTAGETASGAKSFLYLLRRHAPQVVDRESIGMYSFYRPYQRVKELILPTAAGWTEAVTGTGTTTPVVSLLVVNSNNTISSTAIRHCQVSGLTEGTTYAEVDWDKPLLMSFMLRHIGARHATHVSYVQLKQVTTHGDLAALGLGVKLVDVSLKGESYGSAARGEVALMSLTTAKQYKVEVLLDPFRKTVQWYVDGVLKGTQLTRNTIPTGAGGATANLVVSAGNPGDGSSSSIMISPVKLVQLQVL